MQRRAIKDAGIGPSDVCIFFVARLALVWATWKVLL